MDINRRMYLDWIINREIIMQVINRSEFFKKRKAYNADIQLKATNLRREAKRINPDKIFIGLIEIGFHPYDIELFISGRIFDGNLDIIISSLHASHLMREMKSIP